MDAVKTHEHIKCRRLTVVDDDDQVRFSVNCDAEETIVTLKGSNKEEKVILLSNEDGVFLALVNERDGGILISAQPSRNIVSVMRDDSIAVLEANEKGATIRYDDRAI